MDQNLRSRRSIHSLKLVDEDGTQLAKRCTASGRSKKPTQEKIEAETNCEVDNNLYPNLNGVEDVICKEDTTVTNEKQQVLKDTSTGSCSLSKEFILFLVLCIIIIIFGVYFNKFKTSEKSFEVKMYNQTQAEINLDNALYSLEDNIYKRQEEKTWITFAGGIKSVTSETPNKPSVFLLLYDDDLAEKTAKCIAWDVAKAASKYLMNKEIPPVTVPGAELNDPKLINDPGKLLEMMENRIKKAGSMIITHIEDIDPTVATSLHYLCDRFSPLVNKAIYLFTLKYESDSKSPVKKVAEDTLFRLWADDLPDSKLHALITRMTGNVLKILSEKSDCDFSFS
ncbi:uncharacterized protein LOC128983569 [Macrosteles quadrilineatus]|uniref:uncharacterized protein LOC128983569 n=1 Tax=Macrosteles quadrilineatus TaxID=74068 RepID=UPI0023E25CAA|nr:uncharacterized protein LOC128983569 [Macrosteles quadrilineatus]